MAASTSGLLLQQAQSALLEGQHSRAAILCRQVLTRDTRNTQARYFLGLAHAFNGEVDAAIEQWTQLLRFNPRDFAALANLGAALAQLGRHGEAITRLRAALAIDGSQAQVQYNLGNSLLATDDIDSAIASFRSAIALNPRFAQARNNLGVAYRRAGRLVEAGAEFAQAMAIDPGYSDARSNLDSAAQALYDLGVTQHRAGQLDAAVSSYEHVLSLRPDVSDAWRDRGRALESLQRLREALGSYRKALELAPADVGTIAGILSCSVRLCEWSGAAQSLQRLRQTSTGLEALHPFLALSVCEEPAEHLLIGAARSQRTVSPVTAPVQQRKQDRLPRTRIAYVSSDFRDHAVAHLLVGVLERHDREHFEIHAISLAPEDHTSEVGRRLHQAVEHYHDLSVQTDAAISERLRELSIDIAVDLNGYTIGGRPDVFAHRCAPVQVSYLGYAGTTGAPYMDYLLADEMVIPVGEEASYSERIIRLPHCYLPNDDRRPIGAPPSRIQAGLPEQGLVLCAFTNAYKITPAVFEIWMRLLRELPGSVLWLRAMGAEAKANLQREAQARGVPAERLIFAPHVASMAEHLGRQTLADLYLDTLPYNAHSTTCDALWAGVPVLTCTGRSFASRVAASALQAVGLPELITHTLEEYERTALELGRDPQRLRELRAKLAQQRVGSPLFDTNTYCRNLENAFRSMHAESLHELGIQAMRNGQIDVGIELMQRSLQVDPAQPTTLLNLARALMQAGRREAAVAAYDRALAARPYFAEAHYGLGNALMAFNEPHRALESYERLLALDPAHAAGWSNRGNALQGLGRLDEAVESYDRALALRADVAQTHYNRANALRALGRLDAALESYDRALGLNPRLAEAHHNRGLTLRALTKDDVEALEAFDRAIALKPQFVAALIERGNVLRDAQRPGAALESYGRALAVEPACVEALCNRGSVLVDLKRYAEALENYDRAVALKPDSADILGGHATALEEMSLHENAAASLERLLQVSPQHDYALGRLLQARLNGCAWDQYSELLTRATTELVAGRRVVHPFLALVAMPSAALQMRAAQLLHVPDGTPAVQPPARKTRGARSKLRLAYVSADFREHAASYLLAGVFERHDRNLFETTAISLLPPHDSAMGRRVYAGFDRFVDVSGCTNAAVTTLMREMEIDVAVDLMGYTHFGRPEIFARRSAPIQVSYLGHPGTLGAPYIDYILADEFLIPRESAAHYTERVVYLPECFQANDDRCVVGPRPTRSEAGLPSEGLVFCCFNSSFKLNPGIFAIWMRLLCAVPNSTLWLLADRSATQQNLLREAAARGVGASRLVFAEKLPYPQHLGRLGLADLFLDTFPYNAGATASDALRTGVPVLTCAGEPLASRMAGSLLTTVGLPELITYTLEEYERKALELAQQPRLLKALHARLASKLPGTPLFDTARFCRYLEAAYLQMHEHVMRAEGPASFSVAKWRLAP